LIGQQIESLHTQGEIFAAALSEGAVLDSADEGEVLLPDLARQMMRRLVEPTRTRARLFDTAGALIADSNLLRGPGDAVQVSELLSLYLASTIARPIRRLAVAAQRARGRGARIEIPDVTGRNDEIGELAGSLREMTDALWQRMSAIESFAADVAHEIKNPLSSLRSAVETAARLDDPVKQRRLMAIVQDDVERLDRLITDISDASRLDAELSRLEMAPTDIGAMLRALADMHETTRAEGAPRVTLDIADRGRSLIVP